MEIRNGRGSKVGEARKLTRGQSQTPEGGGKVISQRDLSNQKFKDAVQS
jgi:hypothetical protein